MERQLIELDLAARVLGASVDQILSLCAVVGVRPIGDIDNLRIERDTLDRIYAILYAPYRPPQSI